MKEASLLSGIISTAGIFFCYLSYSIFQEGIFKYESADGEKFVYTFLLLFIQCTFNSVASSFFLKAFGSTNKKQLSMKLDASIVGRIISSPLFNNDSKQGKISTFDASTGKHTLLLDHGKLLEKDLTKFDFDYVEAPWYRYMEISFTYICAMLCSNEALKYINYPTQALGKSVKIIPVMLISALVYGKKYGLNKWIRMLLITFGVFCFQYFKQTSKSSEKVNSYYGLTLLASSLLCDGLLGPRQDQMKREYKPNSIEMGIYMNIYSLIYLLIVQIATGTLLPGISFVWKNSDIMFHILILCVFSAVGQNCILYLISQFGSLLSTTVTTVRKFFTILASVVIFGNRMSSMQWVAVVIVFSGLGLEVYARYEEGTRKQTSKNTYKELNVKGS